MEKFLFLSVIALCGTCTLGSSLNAERESRIVNGETAYVAMERYAISLQKRNESDHYFRGHRCGGALITLQHAVTAASCNFDLINGTYIPINPAEYQLFTGRGNFTVVNYNYFIHSISKITVHPQYRPSIPFVNDIAVIHFQRVHEFGQLQPVSLPTTPNTIYVCRVAGWGAQNNTANASTTLMQVLKVPVNPGYCQGNFSGQINYFPDTMMCAAGFLQQANFSGCTGDIGNALVCYGEIYGILIRSKNCTASTDPELYTQVYGFKSWLDGIIGTPAPPTTPSGASTFQPGLAVLAVIAFAQIIITNVSS